MTRDKTTLIFKYQNSTGMLHNFSFAKSVIKSRYPTFDATIHFAAFLPFEVVELKRQNVDVNPEYSDSLDAELFTVHLMFEKPSAATKEAMEAEGGPVRLSPGAVLPPRRVGREAFEAGLDEVRALFVVVCNRLSQLHIPSLYSVSIVLVGNFSYYFIVYEYAYRLNRGHFDQNAFAVKWVANKWSVIQMFLYILFLADL